MRLADGLVRQAHYKFSSARPELVGGLTMTARLGEILNPLKACPERSEGRRSA